MREVKTISYREKIVINFYNLTSTCTHALCHKKFSKSEKSFVKNYKNKMYNFLVYYTYTHVLYIILTN